MAKQSTTMIKDIQRDVKSTLRKYDEFVRATESNRKIGESQKQIPDSNRKMDEQPTQSQLLNLQQQQKVLYDLLQNTHLQEQLLRSGKLIDQSWYDRKQIALNQLAASTSIQQSEIFMTENISPIKQASSRQSTIVVDLQKKKTPKKQQLQMSPIQKQPDSGHSYAQIHGKKSPIKPNPDIIQRNTEWKQKIDYKIQMEQRKKKESEMKNCTFKPKLNSKTIHHNYSLSKEFQKEMTEIVDLIDELSVFRQKLKHN